jgi:hypothetical protein
MSDSDSPASDPDATFVMDPEATMWALARQLVNGQRTQARFDAGMRAAAAGPKTPEILDILSQFNEFRAGWYSEALPSLVASMRLAIEVFDTNGPGVTTISDPIEAAVYNNKYHGWAKELSVEL